MIKNFKTFGSQSDVDLRLEEAVSITGSAKLSLYKKSKKSNIPTSILEEVYSRGYSIWDSSAGGTADQYAFNRVNSFIAGGYAAELDEDIMEDWQDSKYKNPNGGLTQAGVNAYRSEHPGSKLKTAVTKKPSELKAGSKDANRRKSFCARMGGMKKKLTSAETAHDPDSRINKSLRKWHCEDVEDIDEKTGLWDNIHAKQERIKHGSGEKMRKPGSKGAPSAQDFKNSQVKEGLIKKPHDTAKHYNNDETSELQSNDPNDPDSRFDGTTSGKEVYSNATPGQKNYKKKSVNETIRDVIKDKLDEINIRDAAGNIKHLNNVKIRMADGTIKSMPPGKSGSSGGGGK